MFSWRKLWLYQDFVSLCIPENAQITAFIVRTHSSIIWEGGTNATPREDELEGMSTQGHGGAEPHSRAGLLTPDCFFWRENLAYLV